MYIGSHKFFFENNLRIKYSKTENVGCLEELENPIVRETLTDFGITGGLEISSHADIPSGTGLGSSSAFTVGLIHNLLVSQNKLVRKKELAEYACSIEIDKLKEPIGKQDQYACSFGGFRTYAFNHNGVSDTIVNLPKHTIEALEERLYLFYLGNQRKASSILEEQNHNTSNPDKSENLKRMVELVWKAQRVLYDGNIHHFGKLLDIGWKMKKKMASKISNPEIDSIYEKAIQSGASGGKVLGAGGGGFLLLYCEPEHKDALLQTLPDLKLVPFKFTNEGSTVIYVD